MPIEFMQESQPTGSSDNTLFRLTMSYDGSGRRISKTSMRKVAGAADWDTAQVTHYTGIGTEIRENYAGPAKQTKVVVNMPQSLGRYGIEDAENPDMGSGVGYIPNAKFEWYLKNHLGSTMLVYGTQADANPAHSDIGTTFAAYDYRAFGEMVELLPPPTGKVTENFTGKEHDDEISLDYFGARYLDPMLGMWISVDPKRQFSSPYLYAGNGMNPVNAIDENGDEMYQFIIYAHDLDASLMRNMVRLAYGFVEKHPNADYRVVVPHNNVELMKIVNEGQHSIILTHGFTDFENIPIINLFGANADDSRPGLDMTYENLNAGLMSGSSATIFSCFSSWSEDLSNVKPFRGGEQSSVEFPYLNDYSEVFGISGAKDAVNFLDKQYERDNGYTYESY